MVISIIMVIIGIVSFLSLPVAQYPNLVDPEVAVNATYVGGDALTVEKSVATPIGQQMMGVDHMNYMYALNASSGGTMKLTVDFDVKTDPNRVDPNKLAALNITTKEIEQAIRNQNTVNPAGQVGGEPMPGGQVFTYTVLAQGRLETEEQFANIVIRASPDGSFVRIKDIGRAELGAQTYTETCTFNGKSAAALGIYQLPGSNAVDAAKGVRQLMERLKERFPSGLAYSVALDTTDAVTAGMKEIYKTLAEAMILVIIVVFIFLQGWRATLIPLCAVPVALVSTFALFPLLGFSVNTLSLLGLVLAIGLVVDDAIVVVEAVENHIEEGLSPKDAALKAMEEVSSPVAAVAIILAAVFLPTAFIPGLTGRLYQQFAVTIAVSVIFSAFNALTLSPALAALLLKPKKKSGRGPMGFFFKGFNKVFGSATNGYVGICRLLMRRGLLCLLILIPVLLATGWIGRKPARIRSN